MHRVENSRFKNSRTGGTWHAMSHDLNVKNYFRGRKQRMVHATLSLIKQMKNSFLFFLKFFLNAQGLIRAHRVDFFFKKNKHTCSCIRQTRVVQPEVH